MNGSIDMRISQSAFQPFRRMGERLNATATDSDAALFFDLLYCGEMVVKLTTAGSVGALDEDRERHRYRLEHRLVRADGVGEWVESLDDVLVGPASHHLGASARQLQRELTSLHGTSAKSWQMGALSALYRVCKELQADIEPMPAKVSLRRWFSLFSWLRNRTRGHGAPAPSQCADLCGPLYESIEALILNSYLFSRSWAFIRRNLSGKYRVTALTSKAPEFDFLKRSTQYTYTDGIYIAFDDLSAIRLASTDADLSDFFIANGGFTGQAYEMLSYATDERLVLPATDFLAPAEPLPASATEGRATLDIQGKTFGNLPPPPEDYVRRPELESDLHKVLVDDRHPVVTLQGPGGVGKTYLALHVMHQIAATGAFFTMVWCSARDIELLPQGAKVVAPHVLTRDEIADFYATLMQPKEAKQKGFDRIAYLASELAAARGGRLLFIVDNFETVRNPLDLHRWLDNAIRLPNKLLITTRYRDFKGDYPIEVGGMTELEFERLILATANRLNILDLVPANYRAELFTETDGHPYVAKVLLGEVANAGKALPVPRLMADKDAILDALFDRSFQMITPAAQRVFLTLCNWRSLVPRLALEAALLRPANERIDVATAIEGLRRSSLVDVSLASDGQEFLGVPLVAAEFGKRKLSVSPMKSAVDADTDILHSFGAANGTDLAHGIGARIGRLFSRAVASARAGRSLDDYLPVLEYVARRYPAAWLKLADLFEETKFGKDPLGSARDAVRKYLEARPDDGSAWRRLARLYGDTGNTLGEVHALVELAEMSDAPFQEVSSVANRLNALLKSGGLKVDTEERRLLVRRLRSVMENRVSEATATDLSRLAWLCLNLGDDAAANVYVEKGLELDRNNKYCLNLLGRL